MDPFQALVGPSYTLFSPKAEIQLSVNVRRERVESGEGMNPFVLNKAPGLSADIGAPVLEASPVRCFMELNGFLFTVVGSTIALSNTIAGLSSLGTVANDGLPVQAACSPTSIVFVSAGVLYRLSGTLTTPTTPFTPVGVVFLKNYFVALAQASVGSNTQFYWSTDDGITWSAGNVQDAEAQANNIVAIQAINELLCLVGNRYTQWFSVGANPNAPFVPIDSGVMRHGTEAAASVCRIGQSLMWLEENEQGTDSVIITSGFQAINVANNYVSNKIRTLRKTAALSDAIGMAYKQGGQEFYRLTFPGADYTLEFNKTIWEQTGTPEWHDPLWLDTTSGKFHRHRANAIVSVFGMILAGDWQNGNIYQLTPDCFHDFGFPLKSLRRTPHIVQENKRISVSRMELDIQTGVGLSTPLYQNDYSLSPSAFATALAALVPGTISSAQATILTAIYNRQAYNTTVALPSVSVTGALGFYEWGRNPTISLEYSRDGGKSYANPLIRSLGQAGEDVPVYWNNLSTPRDAVYQFTSDDPVQLGIVNAWIDAEALLS